MKNTLATLLVSSLLFALIVSSVPTIVLGCEEEPGCEQPVCESDGWYPTGETTTPSFCQECEIEEYRDYQVVECECDYTVTGTREVCGSANEGEVCDMTGYKCKDSCTRAQEEMVCHSGQCVWGGWVNEEACDPFGCEYGCEEDSCGTTCSMDCGAECESGEDCMDYCDGSIRYFEGSCDEGCACGYQSEDCDDYDDTYPVGECGETEIRDYYCAAHEGTTSCEYKVIDEPTTTTTTIPGTTTTTIPGTTTTTVPTQCETDEDCEEGYVCEGNSCVPETPSTTTTTQPSENGGSTGSEGSGGSTGHTITPCVVNGICEDFEDAKDCPSDCGDGKDEDGTTDGADGEGDGSSAAVCGDDICERGEDYKTCPEDCLDVTPIEGEDDGEGTGITGYFSMINGSAIWLLILLIILALLLWILRFMVLPAIM